MTKEIIFLNNYYEFHVFICMNKRDDGSQCCADFGAEKIFDYMKQKIKLLDLRGKGKVRINKSGCLDRCSEGPLMVVYPDAVWYRYIDEKDIDEIIESHIIKHEEVIRLKV